MLSIKESHNKLVYGMLLVLWHAVRLERQLIVGAPDYSNVSEFVFSCLKCSGDGGWLYHTNTVLTHH